MENFINEPISKAIIGGALIGFSSGLLFLLNGRILGISGIAFKSAKNPISWQTLFISGLLVSGVLANSIGLLNTENISDDWGILLLGGLLVGIGAKIANGCTSGHGIMGIARLSKRSFIAVATFMVFAILTVFLGKVL